MSTSIPTRPLVLCYGKHTNLLESRRMLLQAIGCFVDISDRSMELSRWLNKQPEYALIIVCHTIAAEERLSIESLCRAQGSNTVVYSLEGTMDPKEFTLRVSELLDQVGCRRTVRSLNAPLGLKLLPILAVAC